MDQKLITAVRVGIGAAVSAVAVALAAPAGAMPVPGDNAADAVAELEAGGQNRVLVQNPNDVPLSEAEVVSVMSGSDVRDTVFSQNPYEYDEIRQQVPQGQVYYVTVE